MRTELDQRSTGDALIDQDYRIDLAQPPYALDGSLGTFEHLTRHLTQTLGQLWVFGDELRVANRQRQMVGQVMLERARREAHALKPRLRFQATIYFVCLFWHRHHHGGMAELIHPHGWRNVASALSQG